MLALSAPGRFDTLRCSATDRFSPVAEQRSVSKRLDIDHNFS